MIFTAQDKGAKPAARQFRWFHDSTASVLFWEEDGNHYNNLASPGSAPESDTVRRIANEIVARKLVSPGEMFEVVTA